MNKVRLNIKFIFSCIVILFISFNEINNAQNKLLFQTNLQFAGNKFIDGANHLSTFIYNGIRYQTKDYSLSFTVPIVITGNSSFNQVGNMLLPDINSKNGAVVQSGYSSMRHDVNNMTNINVGIGDLYVYGSYKIIDINYYNLPKISLDTYVKFPTAASSLNIGTGQTDISLAVSLRKNFNNILFYSQIGYLILGDSEALTYENPLTISLGIGSNLNTLKHALYLGYDSYSTILNGIESPKQLSLGYSYIASTSLSYNFIASYGLNSSASDFTISGGLNIGIL